MASNSTLSFALAVALLTSASAVKAQTHLSGWPSANEQVTGLAYDPVTNQVFLGGSFTEVGGQPRSYVASINAATGALTNWAPDLNGWVGSIVVSGGRVYIGGAFDEIDGQTRNHLAAFDAATGALITDWHPNVDWYIYDMEIVGTTLFLAGDFSSVSGVTSHGVAALSTTSFGPVVDWGSQWCDQLVSAVETDGSQVYYGGQFYTIGGATRPRIAALSATTGDATTWNPSANEQVAALELAGPVLYAGGSFSNVGGEYRNHLAALDVGTGLATAWNPAPNEAVGAIAAHGGTVFVGGGFTSIGGASRNGFAALSASTGNALPWDAQLADGPNPIYVYEIVVNGSQVYIGGDFGTVAGSTHPNFAAWNGVSVGLDEQPAVPELALWPSPTAGPVHLQGVPAEADHLEVMDALGRPASRLPYASDIELSDLAPGTYAITVYDAAGEALTRGRLIKAH